jgi:ATP-dependent Clp protease protease subunit
MNGAGGMYGLDDHIYQRLLRERIVFLGSEVRDQNANAICAQLLLLSAEDPEADIFLHINSPGGSVDAGMAIYDTMNYIPNDVATVGMGLAASMGQFLLCAGTKGKRYALPHARIMMHQPSSGMGGSASDIKIQAQQSLHIKKVLLELIAEHTGQTSSRIETTPTATAGSPPTRPSSTASSTRSSRAPASRRRRPPGPAEGLTDMNYYIPQWEERTSVRLPPHRPLRQAVRGPHHLPRHADLRRRRQRGHRPAAVPAVDEPRPGHQHLHQQPGRLVHGADRDLRHDEVHQADVQTVCIGQAASAAAILLAAGTPGQALALPNSRILIHQPYTEGTFGQTSDIEIQANEILRMRELLEKMISDHSGRDLEQVSRDIERDKISTAEGAVEYGLIDAVLSP